MSAQVQLGGEWLPQGKKYYALISGGKDSMSMAHWMGERNLLRGVVFIDTGIRLGSVIDFVETLPHGVEIHRTPVSYDSLVTQYWGAFPGRPLHGQCFNYLKGRAIREFKKAHRGEDYFFASGVRKAESPTRRRNVTGISKLEGITTYAPLVHWGNQDVWSYVRRKEIEISPAYLTLGFSGECLCGSHASKDEFSTIRKVDKEIGERLTRLADITKSQWGNEQNNPDLNDILSAPILCQGDCRLEESPTAKADTEALFRRETK
jgi:3'-phosphoadenosine 5'-phosphosulfate sulfotransferase (PAPS reductase)/FAD synthetase